MKSVLADLKKQGSVSLPNGGKLSRDGSKGVVYEATQKIRVPLKLDSETLESTSLDQPMLVLLESMMGLNYDDVAERVAWLTPRELQVFGEMGMGIKNRKIAESLGISSKTLDIHRANIGRKMGLKSANSFGRVYWFFRLCHEFYPQTLEEMRKKIADD